MPQPAPDLVEVAPSFFIWQNFDPAIRADLFSTALAIRGTTFIVDPIPLHPSQLSQLQYHGRVAGIIVTNTNHQRAAVAYSEDFSAPIFTHADTFAQPKPPRFIQVRACGNCSIFEWSMTLPDRQSETASPLGGALSRFLHLIRFSHTIFALPFALGALIVAAHGLPSARVLLLVLICMVSARTAAMLFNRFVDWSLDQRNPRTASRHLLLSKPAIGALLGLSSALFLAAAAAINRLTFVLSPIAL